MDLDGGTGPTATTRPTRSINFIGTWVSGFVSLPFFAWIPSILRRLAAKQYDCESLSKGSAFDPAITATILIVALFVLYFALAMCQRRWIAALILFLFLVVVVAVITRMGESPKLDNKSTFGIFDSSSGSWLASNNTSEYWNTNVKTCECKTQGCEDFVYRFYFLEVYTEDVFGYNRLSSNDDEPGRYRGVPVHDPHHHEVCYLSKWPGRSKTVCYDCYGCEENYLRREQRYLWGLGNTVYMMQLLLFVSVLVFFASDSWAWYYGD